MGLDRIADHQRAGTEVLTAPDMSCLMHLDGLLRRQGSTMHVMHIAQILAGRPCPTAVSQVRLRAKPVGTEQVHQPCLTRTSSTQSTRPSSSATRSERTGTTRRSGLCVPSGTRQPARCPNGNSCARWLRRSSGTRCRIWPTTWSSSKRRRHGGASTSIGRGRRTNTIRSCWTFCSSTRYGEWSRASRC